MAGQSLRVMVVDDEAPARQLLREHLAGCPGVELVSECRNGFEAVKAVATERPDLVLLDVQMPKLDGFEVLELLVDSPEARPPAVVFVTAFDEYALKAFEVNACDYLLKPVTAERLAEAVERARRRLAEVPPRTVPEAEALAREAKPESPYLDRVLVRAGEKIHVVLCHRLDYVEAAGDALLLVTAEGKLKKAQRLSHLEARLDPGRFVRIHRSYLLNVDRLARLELYAKDSRVAVLRDGSRLPVSRAGYARLRELL
ncbi:MAG: response regulator [Acidobacteriota bacterium]